MGLAIMGKMEMVNIERAMFFGVTPPGFSAPVDCSDLCFLSMR